MEEIWKPVKDYEGLYEVSSMGRVKSLNYRRTGKEKVLKGKLNNSGYLKVTLCKEGKAKEYFIHRLVAIAFIPNPDNLPCIDHINTIKTKNEVVNLRWVTYKENNDNPLTKKKSIENHADMSGSNNPFYGKYGKDFPTSRKVIQLTLEGELVKIWDCILDTKRQGGFSHDCVSACCKGKQKTHKGYKWMYYEDYIN